MTNLINSYRYSSAFVPTDIANLALWLDASDTGTITESGGSVSQWDDKSGNSNHATQGTGSSQPTTGTRTINSLNVLDWSTDYMSLTSAISRTSGYTILVVGNGDDFSADVRAFTGSSTGAGFVFRVDDGPINLEIVRRNQAVLLTGSSTISTATDYIFSGRTSAAGNNAQLNGSSEGSNATNPSYTADLDTIGAQDNGPVDAWDGMIGEIIIYTSILSDSQMNQVGNYLSDKWGITWTGL